MQLRYPDFLQKYGHIVLLAYDALLNMDKEVQAIWKRKLSGSSFLYIAFRFIPLSRALWTDFLSLGPEIPSVCSLHFLKPDHHADSFIRRE